jgi:hypothetical protein
MKEGNLHSAMFFHYLALVLETIFFVGLAGSLVVAIMAFIGDIHVFLEKDKGESPSPRVLDPDAHNLEPSRQRQPRFE